MTDTISSLAKLKLNPAWASLPLFDRTGWKRMAFGEFAESIGERAEPKDAQEEIYVGLEHLDPQCLHIRRWAKGSDVIGGKLRFRKGDIIFGKRRAYQRKLAVAEFCGICSAHAMVIRAKPGKVLPEFLPILMMSDRFMNRVVAIQLALAQNQLDHAQAGERMRGITTAHQLWRTTVSGCQRTRIGERFGADIITIFPRTVYE